MPEYSHAPLHTPSHAERTGANLAGFRAAEDLITPGVEDVVASSVGGHKPHGSDPISDHTMILNMGPQHPSTHGVLRLVIEVDGETIVSLAPDIGYLHTGIEKTCEAKFYQQVIPLTDRIDYLAPMANNLGYALAVEKLLQLEIPERAQWIRVMFQGAHADQLAPGVAGHACARSWRDDGVPVLLPRARTAHAHLRGGQRPAHDDQATSASAVWAMEPPLDLYKAIRDFLRDFPSHVDEYEGLLQNNPIWGGRLKGIGYLSAEDAVNFGVTGPPFAGVGSGF